jgi:hypothetical protein
MRIQKLELADTQAFSSFFLDYIHQKENLKPFLLALSTHRKF